MATKFNVLIVCGIKNFTTHHEAIVEALSSIFHTRIPALTSELSDYNFVTIQVCEQTDLIFDRYNRKIYKIDSMRHAPEYTNYFDFIIYEGCPIYGATSEININSIDMYNSLLKINGGIHVFTPTNWIDGNYACHKPDVSNENPFWKYIKKLEEIGEIASVPPYKCSYIKKTIHVIRGGAKKKSTKKNTKKSTKKNTKKSTKKSIK